jgi:PhnB protein
MDEAVERIKRCPNPHNEEGQIEIRPLFEAGDFATSDPTGELRAAEARLREKVEKPL